MVNYIGIGTLNQISSIKKNNPAATENAKESSATEFTAMLQNAQAAPSTLKTEESSRADRVAELKAQVAQGRYQPDLGKVSASLLQFLQEEK